MPKGKDKKQVPTEDVHANCVAKEEVRLTGALTLPIPSRTVTTLWVQAEQRERELQEKFRTQSRLPDATKAPSKGSGPGF
jgi:hypothetical protein